MAIEIKHRKPATDSLGGAHFSRAGGRYISVCAENSPAAARPIDLHASSEDFRTTLSLSVDEAEALIACLSHAVALRRHADEACRSKEAAAAPLSH